MASGSVGREGDGRVVRLKIAKLYSLSSDIARRPVESDDGVYRKREAAN